MADLTVYLPIRLKPEDAIALDRVVKMERSNRSEVVRSLIRSLGHQNPAIEKTA